MGCHDQAHVATANAGLAGEGLLNGQTAAQVRVRVTTEADLATALRDVVWVQECVPEALPIKLGVLCVTCDVCVVRMSKQE